MRAVRGGGPILAGLSMPLMDMRTALSSAPGGFETEQRPGMTAGGPSGEDSSANAALAPFYTDVVPTLGCVVEADVVRMAEGNTVASMRPRRRHSTGVGQQGMRTRTPQEPGRSGSLLLAGRGTGDQSPGRESKPKEGTAERGKPSGKHGLGRGGTGIQKSERFVVPMKRGNQPPGPRGCAFG